MDVILTMVMIMMMIINLLMIVAISMIEPVRRHGHTLSRNDAK